MSRSWYSWRVSVPRAVLLALALLQAFGITEAMGRAACEEECERDGCKDRCLPGDDDPSCPCHCPSAPNLAPPRKTVAELEPPAQATPIVFHAVVRLRSSPDPREISHVPRPCSV